jgi:hypothetical protein
MDLMNLTPTSDIVEITLKHPNTGDTLTNEDKTPMTITFHAPHSKTYKSAMHEQTNKQLKKSRSGKKEIQVTAEELEASSLDVLVKVTEDWNITYEGKNPPIKKAREIYQKVFWIKEQVEEALADSLDFTKA